MSRVIGVLPTARGSPAMIAIVAMAAAWNRLIGG